MSTVSILTVTLDRYQLLARCLGPAIARCGIDYELLCWDNGSVDQSVIIYLRGLNPVYLREYGSNIGYAPAVNQMILRSTGDYICVLDPDLEMRNDNWLRDLVECEQAIPNTGLAGVHCVMGKSNPVEMNGKWICINGPFGVKFFHRRLLSTVGYFCEEYAPYGVEDNDFIYRVEQMGYLSYYVNHLQCCHAGDDVGQNTPYRKMKWDSLHRAIPIHDANLIRYKETGNYYLPPPELK